MESYIHISRVHIIYDRCVMQAFLYMVYKKEEKEVGTFLRAPYL